MAFSFSSPQFSTPQAQQPQSNPFASFGQPQPSQQFQLQAPQQPPQQMLLCTKEKTPASYSTKWEDLHPDSQKLLLQIEERILEYKDESQRLDQCSRLYDSSVSSDSFELDASQIMLELGGISTALERERVSVQELMNEVNSILWNTEVAVHSYRMLRPRFLHSSVLSNSSIVPANQTAGATSSSMVPVNNFYGGNPKRPSPFMQQTATRFEKYLAECCRWIDELEQLVLKDTNKTSSSSAMSSIQSLPSIMSNVHDFFIHVAAKVESLHQYIESMKTAYLTDQRRRGEGNDPFLEADRRAIAKQEAAARRVHPTLHLPPSAQPSTEGTNLFASSAMPVLSLPQQTAGSSEPAKGSSIFSTPSSAAPASTPSSLFFTPSSSAPTSSLFGSTGFSSQTTPFGTTSTSLFGSAPTSLTVGASTSSFGTTPATGFLTGSMAGSGSSFSGASNKSRQKARASRR